METKLKKKPRCCSDLMVLVPTQNMFFEEISEVHQWVCKSCGTYVILTEGRLDEEELENLVVNYDL